MLLAIALAGLIRPVSVVADGWAIKVAELELEVQTPSSHPLCRHCRGSEWARPVLARKRLWSLDTAEGFQFPFN